MSLETSPEGGDVHSIRQLELHLGGCRHLTILPSEQGLSFVFRVVRKAGDGGKRRVDTARVPAEHIECTIAESFCYFLSGSPRKRRPAPAWTTWLDHEGALALATVGGGQTDFIVVTSKSGVLELWGGGPGGAAGRAGGGGGRGGGGAA